MYYYKLLDHVIITSGWIAVQPGNGFDFNLEKYSLNIKTNSTLGSNDKVKMGFYSSQRDSVGGITLLFHSTQYRIWNCYSNYANYITNLPAADEKVWRVTLTRISGIRLVLHCNEVEVVNTLMSNSTCHHSWWNTPWSREVAKIWFTSSDTASDYYQPQPGNLNCVFLKI